MPGFFRTSATLFENKKTSYPAGKNPVSSRESNGEYFHGGAASKTRFKSASGSLVKNFKQFKSPIRSLTFNVAQQLHAEESVTHVENMDNSINIRKNIPLDYRKEGFFRSYTDEKRFRTTSRIPLGEEEPFKEGGIKNTLLRLAHEFNRGSKEKPFENTLLVGVQHMLATTVDMFEVMQELGLEDAIVGGKSYSTHLPSVNRFKKLGYEFVPEAEQLGYGRFNDAMREVTYRIWEKALNKIKKKKYDLVIALDDGADLLLTTTGKLFNGIKNRPDAVIGIEQTRGGSNHPLFCGLPFPIINLAGSYVKSTEYRYVAESIAKEIDELIKNKIEPCLSRKPIIGIVGYGSMGQAIASKMLAMKLPVFIYDKNSDRRAENQNIIHCPDTAALVNSADVIIGCTGEDITASENVLFALLYTPRKKWLISTTSKDIEINNYLRVIQNETKQLGQIPNPLETFCHKNRVGVDIEIESGGFPINFKGKAHSVPPEKIWPTRASIILACLMCSSLYNSKTFLLKNSPGILKLEPKGQLMILREYQRLNPHDNCLKPFEGLTERKTLDYIQMHSEGEAIDITENNISRFRPG